MQQRRGPSSSAAGYGTLGAGLASLGAGLVCYALAAGRAPIVAAALAAGATGLCAWGVWVLRAGRLRASGLAAALHTATFLVGLVLLVNGQIGFPPFFALFIFSWGTCLLLAWQRRRSIRALLGAENPVRRPRPGRLVVVLAVEAMLVAAIATPALADTEPGRSAVPHGAGLHDH